MKNRFQEQNDKNMIHDICIPKMDAKVSEREVRIGIEKTKIGKVRQYKETPCTSDRSIKKILMSIDWNKEHAQYTQLKERLENGKSVKIVNDTVIWHIYKNNVELWTRGLKVVFC